MCSFLINLLISDRCWNDVAMQFVSEFFVRNVSWMLLRPRASPPTLTGDEEPDIEDSSFLDSSKWSSSSEQLQPEKGNYEENNTTPQEEIENEGKAHHEMYSSFHPELAALETETVCSYRLVTTFQVFQPSFEFVSELFLVNTAGFNCELSIGHVSGWLLSIQLFFVYFFV